jgi:tRNA (guanine10-N2)-methyltransferase
MKDPDYEFVVMENYVIGEKVPNMIYFGRWIADGGRHLSLKYDLKKRAYISTTSMDAELALITANMALAAPGKLFYDPFLGTGSFPVACSHFGAHTLGSDIDARCSRGTPERNIQTNFDQYELRSLWLGNFVSDLTNTPLRISRCFDGIVCDPPYGVREGLKVLGRKDGLGKEVVYIDGVPAHLYVFLSHSAFSHLVLTISVP